MTRRIALAAVSLAAAASFATPQAANACTVDITCSYLNIVCRVATGNHCV